MFIKANPTSNYMISINLNILKLICEVIQYFLLVQIHLISWVLSVFLSIFLNIFLYNFLCIYFQSFPQFLLYDFYNNLFYVILNVLLNMCLLILTTLSMPFFFPLENFSVLHFTISLFMDIFMCFLSSLYIGFIL